MSRREFSKQIKRDAFARAKGRCEGWLPNGTLCEAKLTLGKFHYDHVIPDAHDGAPTLDNCAVLCIACHKYKTTTKDVPAIAKTKRILDQRMGIRKASRLQSRGFAKSRPQRTASRPIARHS